ncbi:Formyltetrahydrofolate deformylase 1, mitochondrial, partial [Ananas comosus]
AHFCSNHNRAPNTHVIRFLERHGIPYHYLPRTLGNKREQEILELVEETDFLVLARYMQILSGNFWKLMIKISLTFTMASSVIQGQKSVQTCVEKSLTEIPYGAL